MKVVNTFIKDRLLPSLLLLHPSLKVVLALLMILIDVNGVDVIVGDDVVC